MKMTLLAGVAVACLALSGCATAGLKPADARQLIADFHNAGCGGRVDLDAGAATGQLGGSAHVQLGLHGECPTGDKPAAPVSVKVGDLVAAPSPSDPSAIPR